MKRRGATVLSLSSCSNYYNYQPKKRKTPKNKREG